SELWPADPGAQQGMPPGGAPLWPMLAHDAQHSGRGSAAGPRAPHERWSLAVNPFAESPVVGSDGTIYVLGASGAEAVDPTDGSVLWTSNMGCGGLALGPDGTIYLSSLCTDLARIAALDPATHQPRWIAEGIESSSSVTVGDD